MKDYLQHIEELYRDALVEQELKPSVSFKTRISLLFLFFQVKRILVVVLILLGIAIGGYFGYLSMNNDSYYEVNTDINNSYEIEEVAENVDIKGNVLIVEDVESDELVVSVSDDSFEELDINGSTVIEEVYTQKEDVASIYKYEEVIISKIKCKMVSNIFIDSTIEPMFKTITASTNIDSIIAEKDEVEELDLISNENLEKAKLFSFSLYVSPTITTASITLDNGYSEYLNLRDKNEFSTFSWSAGGDIQIHLKNWFIQTGINYSVYRNDKNYNYSYQLLDSANSYFDYDTIWVWIYDPPNLEYPVMVGIDTTWVPVYEDISVVDKGDNEWSYLEIPVLIGYKFNYHKFDFEIATGISFGFLMNYRGSLPRFPDAEGMEDLKQLDININKTMYNYILQMGVSYNFKNNWSVIAQPYFKQNLHSVFDNSYPVTQKFNAFGLNVGLRVSF